MATRHPEQYRRMIARLREVREELGLTQEDVAGELGVRQAFISRIEVRERRIDPTELYELARLYGKRMSFFLED